MRNQMAGWVVGLVIGTTAAVVGGLPGVAQTVAPRPADQSAAVKEIDRLINEGWSLFKAGSAESLQKAIGQFEKALELSRVANAQDKQAFSLLVLGRISHDFGKTQKALDYYNQALTLLRAIGDQNGEAITLNNIGLVHCGGPQKLNRSLSSENSNCDRSISWAINANSTMPTSKPK